MTNVSKCQLTDDALVLINFNFNWHQDDIRDLATNVFSLLPEHRIIEHIVGADREYYRFKFLSEYLILHFESYSNSCWLEAEDQLENPALAIIATQLNNAIN
ncbi:DUF3630 family protein [Thalassotalea sp. ND16A]|uniref:DUF3630 family protein n=1 Tax=Thalassotalea sp. ND16A TaxID=1535422 RepID=UPI00051D5B21|nr:DUF3630 family protein [Thalassotalea sp. ND16A]KGJ98049.1 hypothetical protein ND16A_0854 [Thalassotalea sp. ND16A]